MKKYLLLLGFLLLVGAVAKAEPIIEKKDKSLWIKAATTREVEDLFEKYNFNNFSEVRMKFPRIFIKKLPSDWASVPQTDNKHRLFIKMLLPLVLKVNEEVSKERAEIEKINAKFRNNEKLSKDEIKVISQKAEKYDVFTHLEGDARTSVLLNRLLVKIDIIPPSVMISTAAIYTDWGTSRLALQANSLYQEEVWYDNQGLQPKDDVNADYRYKVFADLEECMLARALKLNSHINYDYFREARKQSRQRKRPPFGQQLAVKMMQDSNLKNIAGMIDYTFTYYGLIKTDYFPQLEDVK